MGSRFRYEPQSAMQKLGTALRQPHRWRVSTTPWIRDYEGGSRFQLTPDEVELIDRLNVPVPGRSQWPASPVTLDEVAKAIRLRRLGYVSEWTRLTGMASGRTPHRPRQR